ncbi:MAG: hypothetical protein U5J64_10760 [Halobacteriales archaeon]|nr:hypothetical protein [Halobacteriales archaeon]
MGTKQKELVEFLRDEVGDSLRAVGKYDREGYRVLYARDDVVDEFSQEDIEKIHHEMVLKGLGNQHIESLFNDEELECSIYQFESIVRLHFVKEDYLGHYVSFDYSGEINPSRIVDNCKELLQ